MSNFRFSKEKYLEIANSQGISKALTQLQKDTIRWEHQAFEGKAGYLPEMWKELHAVREFSRELWELSLRSPNNESK